MSLKIEINLGDDGGVNRGLLAQHMQALGFSDGLRIEWKPATISADCGGVVGATIVDPSGASFSSDDIEHSAAPAPAEQAAEPAPEPAPKRRGRQRKEETPQISTGEPRVGPTDDPAIAAQDAADEAAEAEAGRKPDAPLTLDDVRHAAGKLIERVGFTEAQKLVPKLLGRAIHELPDDQAELAAAIQKLEQAEALTSAVSEPDVKPATRDDVKAAMMAYVQKYGDEAAKRNRGALFAQALGPVPAGLTNAKGEPVGEWTFTTLPDDPAALARVVAAWRA